MTLSSRRAPTDSPTTSTHLPASVPIAWPPLCVDGLCAPISDKAPRWTLDPHPLAYSARPPRTPLCYQSHLFYRIIPTSYNLLHSLIFKNETRDCPGGPMVKNPPVNAGHGGSIPGTGESHMPQSNQVSASQLLKPRCLELVLGITRSHCGEKSAHRNGRWPLLAAIREIATRAQRLRLSTAQNKISK